MLDFSLELSRKTSRNNHSSTTQCVVCLAVDSPNMKTFAAVFKVIVTSALMPCSCCGRGRWGHGRQHPLGPHELAGRDLWAGRCSPWQEGYQLAAAPEARAGLPRRLCQPAAWPAGCPGPLASSQPPQHYLLIAYADMPTSPQPPPDTSC